MHIHIYSGTHPLWLLVLVRMCSPSYAIPSAMPCHAIPAVGVAVHGWGEQLYMHESSRMYTRVDAGKREE